MPLTLRTASPADDPRVRELIERAFDRAGRETLLAERLATAVPSFDPGLALVAQNDGRDAGCAIFLPREFHLRGAAVPMCVAGLLGVPREERGAGVGSYLLRAGLAALRDRGLRGVVALGAPEFFARRGFVSAFNLYTYTANASQLPEGGESDRWRGITQDDIRRLRALQEDNYAEVAGTELRSEAALDWESSAPHSHTLAYEEDGQVEAYLRFRVRDRVEIREGAVASERGLAAVLRFLRRLAREHGRPAVLVHVPPPHPLARALFHLGCTSTASHFGGAALLAVEDWLGLLRDTRASWSAALRAADVASVSLDLGGESVRLALDGGALEVEPGLDPERHVHVPASLAPALVSGQRSWRDLVEHPEAAERSRLDDAGRRLVPHLFPAGTPMWTYSPIFEIADD